MLAFSFLTGGRSATIGKGHRGVRDNLLYYVVYYVSLALSRPTVDFNLLGSDRTWSSPDNSNQVLCAFNTGKINGLFGYQGS